MGEHGPLIPLEKCHTRSFRIRDRGVDPRQWEADQEMIHSGVADRVSYQVNWRNRGPLWPRLDDRCGQKTARQWSGSFGPMTERPSTFVKP